MFAIRRMVVLMDPWSKKHKTVFASGVRHSLSNSFAQPLSHSELVALTIGRGDRELVDAFDSHALCYTPNGGSVDLREEIAKLYGPEIGPENVLVFPGAQVSAVMPPVFCPIPHLAISGDGVRAVACSINSSFTWMAQVALQTAAFALASDCHSITFTPGYQSTVETPLHAGGQSTQIRLKASNGWQIDPEEVQAAIRDDTRYMVINQPYNPAGTLMSAELQAELIATAEAHGIYVLCDEVYRLLEVTSSCIASSSEIEDLLRTDG